MIIGNINYKDNFRGVINFLHGVIVMTQNKERNVQYWIHTAIGLLLMFGIPLLPPLEPITEIGMQLGGIFIGLIYLWTMVETFWPSLLAAVALIFTDYANINSVVSMFGAYMPLLALFAMILYGGVGSCGLTQYIGRWFLTRKIINGRPIVFTFCMMLLVYIVSAFVDPLLALLVIWPVICETLESVGYNRTDKYPKILLVSTFLTLQMGLCLLGFFPPTLIILSSFEAASGIATNYALYMLLNIFTSLIFMLVAVLVIKYVLRPDMSKLKNYSIEQMRQNPLPPMNIQQKVYIGVIVAILLYVIVPMFLPADSIITKLISQLDLFGFFILAIAVLSLVKIDGEPILDTAKITKECVVWDLFLMLSLVMFYSTSLLDEQTGIQAWLVNTLVPIFSGYSSIVFILAIIVTGILITNIANNAVTGAILMQIIVAVAPSLGITNMVPLAMIVTLAMFLAVLTPAASPYAAVMHTNKDWLTSNDITKYGLVMMLIAFLVYVLVGLPFANILF